MNTATTGITGREPLFTVRFCLSCATHFTGAMALAFYILFPLFIRSLGGTELTIGVYAGIAGAAAVVARWPVGRLLDSHGRRRVLLAAGLLHVASWLGFLWIDHLGVGSVLLVIAHGLAGGSLFAAYFTYASDITPASRRAEGIAMFGIWGMLPNGLGPWLGEFLLDGGSFSVLFLVAAAFAAVSFGVSTLLSETAPRPHDSSPRGAIAMQPLPYRELLAPLFTTFVFGSAFYCLFTFLVPFAYAAGHGSVSRFFLSYSFTAVAVRVLGGRVPDRIGLRRVLFPALVLFAAGVFAVPHVGPNGLILVGVACGAGHGYVFPILTVLTAERVSPAQRGRAVTWFTVMFDLGTTVASPACGAVAEWQGYPVMFTLAGVAMLAGVTVMWRKS
jgi:MFS family permease